MLRKSRQRQPVLTPTRLSLEALEDRCLLSGNVLQTNLVSDLPGVAQTQDLQLVNPWGISESATSPFWVSDNGTGVSTLYNTAGAKQGLVVTIPSADPTAEHGTPTGTVFNGGSGVTVSKNGVTGPSRFLFATEDGLIVGWSPAVDATHAIVVGPTPAGAVYKGLAIATDTSGTAPVTRLYAANFHAGTVDAWDSNFKPVTGGFTDPDLPKGYAPFNVQALGGKIYVTYAKQDAAKHDDVPGEGHGFVDVFNPDGSPGLPGGKERLVSRGRLDSPWGLALAPASFGDLAGDLLVGNFGNGRINVYNPTTGAFLGQLKDPDGEPIAIDGLWALQVGNGGNGGDKNTVYFTAGLFGESHGLFGSLTSVAAGTPEGPAEQQMVTAAQDVFNLAVDALNKDIASGASRATIKQDIKEVKAAFAQFARAEAAYLRDVAADAGLSGHGHGGHDHDGDHDCDDTSALDRVFADLFR